MYLVDSHCHLDFPQFDKDRVAIIRECEQAGIKQFIVPGVSAATWSRLSHVAKDFSCIHIAYGLHPYFVDEHKQADVLKLERILKTNKPVAIGEIGLDFYRKDLDPVKQQTLFEEQLSLAQELQLPVILHVRKAHQQTLETLKKYQLVGGVVHAFNGSYEQARSYMDLGFSFGLGGALTYANATKLRSLALRLPLQNIFLETDSPDMSPANFTGAYNTPLTILKVLAVLHEIRPDSISTITETTTNNVLAMFKIPSCT